MKSAEPASGILDVFPEDELARLQLRVAQRADELARQDAGVRGRDLEHWLEAEHEIVALGALPRRG